MKCRMNRFPLLGLLAMMAVAGAGCGAVSNSARFEPSYAPRADTLIEVGPVTNDAGKTFDFDVQQTFADALTEHLQTDNAL